jgi:5-methyltetrahydrofolate corrinoid/iron sulfur protein methyltransferase
MEIIGELINTSRKLIKEAVEKRDAHYIKQIAKEQEKAGATYIDVNCGTFIKDEVEIMEWLVDNIQKASELPLCIDSPNPHALEAGLKKATHNRKAMINSITNETSRWKAIFPLVHKYKTKVVALCIDNKGMPKTQADRIRIANALIKKLIAEGLHLKDIYIDPLIKPISTGSKHGIEVMEAVSTIMKKYPGVHTVCGLTNISYSLPARNVINRTFMIQLMAYGMDSFILDPTNKELEGAFMASYALLGHDRFCKKFIDAFRAGLYK